MSAGEHFVWSAIGLEDIKDLSRVMDVSGGVIFSEMDAQEKTMISKEEQRQTIQKTSRSFWNSYYHTRN